MQELFALSGGTVFLQHAAYGGAFRLARQVQIWYQSAMEGCPSCFVEEVFASAAASASSSLAKLLGGGKGDFVPVPTAAHSLHAVLTSGQFGSGDRLILSSITSPAARNVAVRWAARLGAEIGEVILDQEILQSRSRILQAFEAALAGISGVKLAILDHVCTFPPVVLPIREITSLCHRYGCKVWVDGSDAVGGLPVDIPTLGVQFYTADLSKWFCAPKGASFLWVHRREQGNVRPVVASQGSGLSFQQEFVWTGAGDLSAWMAIPAAGKIFQLLGFSEIRRRNLWLLQSATNLLLAAWESVELLGLEEDGVPAAAVSLPNVPDRMVSHDVAWELHRGLRIRYAIEASIKCWKGRLWVQISANLYNCIQEYERLAHAVPKLLEQFDQSTSRPTRPPSPPPGFMAPPPGFDTPCYKPAPKYKPPKPVPRSPPQIDHVAQPMPPVEPEDPASSYPPVVRTYGWGGTIAAQHSNQDFA
ncbi:hypothetical protein BSKO_10460 [Bryopsis sp. KO-2023]|nr:hypothetical protein BSKO_10460 [Bryopsis sp. KO-2023]